MTTLKLYVFENVFRESPEDSGGMVVVVATSRDAALVFIKEKFGIEPGERLDRKDWLSPIIMVLDERRLLPQQGIVSYSFGNFSSITPYSF